MANINELLARAAALRDETALNSIDPERAGGIMYDTLIALNELWLQQGAALVISKIYASVAAMNADTSPVSDLTGQPLRPGMIVVIASSDSDNGSVYRYNGTDSPSWSLVGNIGSQYVSVSQNTITIGGVSHEIAEDKVEIASINLTDIDKIQDGYIIDWGSGNPYPVSGYSISDFIPVNGNDVIIGFALSVINSVAPCAVYDRNKQFLRVVSYPSGNISPCQYTYQNGDAYIRFTIQTGWRQYPEMIESNYGTSLIAYQPYNPISGYLLDVYSKIAQKQDSLTFDSKPLDNSDNPVKSKGIKGVNNVFDYSKIDSASVNLTDISRCKDGYFLGWDGFEVAQNGYSITDYIPVNGKDIIILTAYSYESIVTSGVVYDKNFAILRTLGTSLQYTYQDGDAFVRFSIQTQWKQYPDYIRSNYGTAILPYEEYNPIKKYIKPLEQKVNIISTTIENPELSRIILYVKKDGTGDFTDIQSAINSISDASYFKQYEIRVCDDFYITDLRDLYFVWNPTTHNDSAIAPANPIAAIITKDYVNIVGYNRRRVVSVESPYDLQASSFQYVQCLFTIGNVTIENIDFILKNGRYPIHQESGGDTTSQDHNATTVYKNVRAFHLGNDDSAAGVSAWDAIEGIGIGTCSGLNLVFDNVEVSPLMSFHCNKNYERTNTFKFKNCKTLPAIVPNIQSNYISTYGCGQSLEITIEDSNMWMMGVRFSVNPANVLSDACNDIRTFIPNYKGAGNAPMVVLTYFLDCVLSFYTDNNNENIDVVGGSAKADIFGEKFENYNGTSDAHGRVFGTEFIDTGVFSLGNRLGDCSSTPKTLILSVNGVQQSISLNVDFSNMSNADVLTHINGLLSGCKASMSGSDDIRKMIPFDDAYVFGWNRTQKTIFSGAPVAFDATNPLGIKVCSANDTIIGVACERINPGESGKVALLEKNLFVSIRSTDLSGTYQKITGNDGYFAPTTNDSEAVLVHKGNGIWGRG